MKESGGVYDLTSMNNYLIRKFMCSTEKGEKGRKVSIEERENREVIAVSIVKSKPEEPLYDPAWHSAQ